MHDFLGEMGKQNGSSSTQITASISQCDIKQVISLQMMFEKSLPLIKGAGWVSRLSVLLHMTSCEQRFSSRMLAVSIKAYC